MGRLWDPAVDHPASLRAGGRRAFAQLYRDEFAFAWRALQQLGVPAADCEDAVHDVFLTAHRRWATQREPDRQRAWLAGIVRRIAWRHRRALQRRERKLAAIARAEPSTRSLDEELARREAWAELVQFLDALDEPKRAAFVLGELEALGRIELGAALGVNPNTAYSRLLAARGSFARHFGARGEEACRQLVVRAAEHSEPAPAAEARCWGALAGLLGGTAGTSTLAIGWGAIAAVVVAGLASTLVPVAAPVRASAIAATEATPSKPLPSSTVAQAQPAVPAPVEAEVASTTEARPRATPRPIAERTDRGRTSGDSDEPPAPSPIGDEIALLVAAREALVAGDHDGARRRLAEHERRFGTATTLDDVRSELERELSQAPITPAKSGD